MDGLGSGLVFLKLLLQLQLSIRLHVADAWQVQKLMRVCDELRQNHRQHKTGRI